MKKSTVLLSAKFIGFAFVFTATALFLGFNISRFSLGFFSESSLPADVREKPIIIIDAGHGGEDGGASSDGGILEKDLNLAIAKDLAALLSLSGYDVRLTRSEDKMLYDLYTNESEYRNLKKSYDLRNRIKFAKESGGTLFLSIHCNKFPEAKYHGLQVFYSANTPESKELAEHIKDYNAAYLDKDNGREVKEAYSSIYILKNIRIPAVLVECGFLSNQSDAEMLNSPDHRAKLAAMLASSVSDYLSKSDAP